MAGIAEAMSGMAAGKRHGGISGAMEPGSEREAKPEGEHDGGGVEGHLQALHSELGGKHMHVHQHEGGLTSHHVGEDGKVEGPHDHESTEQLKEHMAKFFDEEAHESPSEDHDGLI